MSVSWIYAESSLVGAVLLVIPIDGGGVNATQLAKRGSETRHNLESNRRILVPARSSSGNS